jgi:hypothetical protein
MACLLFIYLWDGGLNLGQCACKVGAVLLEPNLRSEFILNGLLGAETSLKEVDHWGVTLKGKSCPWLPHPLFSLLLGHHDVSSFVLPYSSSPQAQKQYQPAWVETSKTVSQNKFLSLSSFLRHFVTVTKNNYYQ